jgi:L-ascorbate metabolism protein UlaG (beta-lactamase superfamily)
MTRGKFIKTSMLLAGTPLLAQMPDAAATPFRKNSIRLLRHATLVVELNNVKFLIDPMFSVKGAMDPVKNAGNDIRIPMVDMPVNNIMLKELIDSVDAVLITHLHRDHWDIAAQSMIDKSKPVFCQPGDRAQILSQGFELVTSVEDTVLWRNITLHRTNGHHGRGEIEKTMGEVSGFVITSGEKSTYVAGDTVWCDEVEQALKKYQPDITVLNCGGAKFLEGDAITMSTEDVIACCEASSLGKFAAVHMDTLNHCIVTRQLLHQSLSANNLLNRVAIPEDGEVIYW